MTKFILSKIVPKNIEGLEPSKIEELRKQCAELLKVFDTNKKDYRIRALQRYINMLDNYPIDTELVSYLKKKIISSDSKSFLDLGCASGDLLFELRENRTDFTIKGIDINPKFVITANKKGIDADIGFIDTELVGLKDREFDCVITNLTLDRVADPKKLIQNIIGYTKIGGIFIIGTLLPIESNDKRFSRNVTEYTEPNKKVTRGEHVEEDKYQFVQFLQENFAQNIVIEKYPYMQKGEIFENYYIMHGIKK